MTDPGAFNRRLALEAPVETADGAGGVVRSYLEAGSIWAEVTPIAARFATIADAAGASVTHRVRVRAPLDITTKHRLRLGDRVWRVVAVHEETARRFLIIEAQERRA